MVVCQKVKVGLGENEVGLGKITGVVVVECRDGFENHLQWEKV